MRVAGSNPVFRSKQNRRSGTLSRVPDCVDRGWFAHAVPIVCPCRAHGCSQVMVRSADAEIMGRSKRPPTPSGPMRQRTSGSWELLAYAGVYAFPGRVTYRTRTVRGTKAEAVAGLRELVALAQSGPAFGARASFASLLEAWLAAKAATWSASTLRETKSIVGRHLVPPRFSAGGCGDNGADRSDLG